jgi:type IV fimbrial biogenesis protein FimT
MGNRTRMAGLSMVELMVTITVLAILMAVAVPSFRAVMNRGNVATAMNSLNADMQFARGQASSQHRFVSICRSLSGTGCDVAGSSPFDYDVGWLVYSYDVSSTGANQAYSGTGAGMTILRYTPKIRGVSIRATDGKVFTFNQTGQFVTGTGRTTLTFIACARKNVDNTDGTVGLNVAGMQGSSLVLRQSGSLTVTQLPLGSACTP